MFHSDRHKNVMREMAGVRNVDMLTQLPGSMSTAEIFVYPEEVSDFSVWTSNGMLILPHTLSFHRLCVILFYEPAMGC
jgi:hypothetical protein